MQQQLNLTWTAVASMLCCCLALTISPRLFQLLFKRVRWLLLSTIILFSLMTPGVLAFSVWGVGVITVDGLLAGTEQVLRLVAMLGLLALLLVLIGHDSIIAGLYTLLRPLSAFNVDRRRVAVRMLLVLDYVALGRREWRTLIGTSAPEMEQGSIAIPDFSFGKSDIALGLTAIAIIIASRLS